VLSQRGDTAGLLTDYALAQVTAGIVAVPVFRAAPAQVGEH
jgi:hypothetical protein